MMARFRNFNNVKKSQVQCVSNKCKDLFKQTKYFGVMGTLSSLSVVHCVRSVVFIQTRALSFLLKHFSMYVVLFTLISNNSAVHL